MQPTSGRPRNQLIWPRDSPSKEILLFYILGFKTRSPNHTQDIMPAQTSHKGYTKPRTIDPSYTSFFRQTVLLGLHVKRFARDAICASASARNLFLAFLPQPAGAGERTFAFALRLFDTRAARSCTGPRVTCPALSSQEHGPRNHSSHELRGIGERMLWPKCQAGKMQKDSPFQKGSGPPGPSLEQSRTPPCRALRVER